MPSISKIFGVAIGALLLSNSTTAQLGGQKSYIQQPAVDTQRQIQAVAGPNSGKGEQARPHRLPGPLVPTSRVASLATEELDRLYDFGFSTTLGKLTNEFKEVIESPVLIDDQTLKIAGLNETDTIDFSELEIPLRTALRKILRPRALKFVVHDDGILIEPDYDVLTSRGQHLSQWINVDDAAERNIAEALEELIDIHIQDEPLQSVTEFLSRETGIVIDMDLRALDEIGLTPDIPVTKTIRGIKTKAAIDLMLKDFDLTTAVFEEVLTITTIEACESNLLNRIYWLEGTSAQRGDFDSLMQTLQATIVPDTWEAVGGPSTMSPLVGRGDRPGIVTSTTYNVHRQIEKMLAAVRGTARLSAIEQPVKEMRNRDSEPAKGQAHTRQACSGSVWAS